MFPQGAKFGKLELISKYLAWFQEKKEIQSFFFRKESTANWELWTHLINSTINDKIGRLFISEACTLVSVLAGKLGI